MSDVKNSLEREVVFKAADGWRIAGSLHIPKSKRPIPAVIFIHGSRHESDAYGNLTAPGIPQTLRSHNIATLRIDIRGRGASREPRALSSMAPDEVARVALDVEAAIKFVGSARGGDASRIGVVAEQDSATAAILAGSRNRKVQAFMLISGRLSEAAKAAVRRTRAPLLCLVSKEDRRGFKDMVDAFLASKSQLSRIRVFEGLALGTTMFSTWRNEFPHEQPIDELAGLWLAQILSGKKAINTNRRKRAQ